MSDTQRRLQHTAFSTQQNNRPEWPLFKRLKTQTQRPKKRKKTYLFRFVQHQVHVLVEPEDLSFYPHLRVLVQPDLYPRSLRVGKVNKKNKKARGEKRTTQQANGHTQTKKKGSYVVKGTTTGGDKQDM